MGMVARLHTPVRTVHLRRDAFFSLGLSIAEVPSVKDFVHFTSCLLSDLLGDLGSPSDLSSFKDQLHFIRVNESVLILIQLCPPGNDALRRAAFGKVP